MRKNKYKKKFIYLISPTKIASDEFYFNLNKVLKTKKVIYFQLRLKKYPKHKILIIGKKIKKICLKNKVKLIINDDPLLAKKIGADGCHLGQKDMKIVRARKILNKKIIGLTCHNSKKLIDNAIKNNPDYIAIGAFFNSKQKKLNIRQILVL